MIELRLALSDEQLDVIAQRVANLLAERQPSASDAWLRGADQIAGYLGCPRSRVYALVSAKRIPVERDGSNLIARKSQLDGWLRQGGAKRP